MKRYLVFVLESLGVMEESGSHAVKVNSIYLTSSNNKTLTEEQAHARYMESNPQGKCEIFTITEPFDLIMPLKTPGMDIQADASAPADSTHDPKTQTANMYGVTNKPHI